MDEITQKALRKALGFNYWTVDKWLYYLIQAGPTHTDKYYFQNGSADSDISKGDLDNFARQTSKHNEEMSLKTAMRYEELKAHWFDTDHLVQPRNKTSTPTDTDAEFSIHYFIKWAHSRKIKIYWLNWAVSQQLIPIPVEPVKAERPIYSVDWAKWGKIRRIELGDACGLLAGIDLSEYRFMRNKHDEWIQLHSESEIDIEIDLSADNRRDINASADRIIFKGKIENVAANHIRSDCFIDYELVEISLDLAKEYTLHGQLPEGTKSAHNVYVDLPAFGKWAASAGYELPPEFPTTSDKNKAKAVGASKGGKARAEIYSGSKEVCRNFAKSLRAGKAHGEKPSLDDCTRHIDEDRNNIEAQHNVTLPKAGTIRDYLKTTNGEDPI